MRRLLCCLVLLAAAATDLYEVLGVPRDATTAELKKAYRSMAAEIHPDKLPPDTSDAARERATAAFVERALAHEVLTDPVRRQTYDDTGMSEEGDEAREARDPARDFGVRARDARDPGPCCGVDAREASRDGTRTTRRMSERTLHTYGALLDEAKRKNVDVGELGSTLATSRARAGEDAMRGRDEEDPGGDRPRAVPRLEKDHGDGGLSHMATELCVYKCQRCGLSRNGIIF